MGITTTGDSLGDSTDGYVTPNPEVYNAVADETEHEVDTGTLNPKEPPRHDKYAAENTGQEETRVVPYTPSNSNPSYEDGGPGIGEPAAFAPGREKDLIEPEEAPIQVGDQVADIGEVEQIRADENVSAERALELADTEAAPAAEDGDYVADVPESIDPEVVEGDGEQVAETPTGGVDSTGVTQPAGNASGEEWRAYAVSQGMLAEEADTWSRDELRDFHLYGPAPAGNGTKEDWVAYALRRGSTEADLEGLTRDEIRDQYGA